MNHFIEISQLSTEQITQCIHKALELKQANHYPEYSQNTVANLFYENSTRTRVSFELAARRLSMEVINLDIKTSSEQKGEAIEDTFLTLAAMGINIFVIRHSQEGLPQLITESHRLNHIHIINAGDGKHAHPSQAMLDMVTIMEQKPQIQDLKIAILGDILHSRVANSLQCICKALNVGALTMVAPEAWYPQHIHYGTVTNTTLEGLKDADVIICLRVQKERFSEDESLDLAEFQKEYMLNQEKLELAKPDVMVLHPGPMNRNIEIDEQIAYGPHSYILQQVKNGVFTRMAILDNLINNSN